MTKTTIVEVLNEKDLKSQHRDLIYIGDANSGRADDKEVSRAQAKNLIRIARAIALLARLTLMRKWDRVFLIVQNRVLMRFPDGGLLSEARQDMSAIVTLLEDFNRWTDARLLLVVRALALQDVEQPGIELGEDISAARETLAKFRARKAPSGESLDSIFGEWVTARARVNEFWLTAGKPEGEAARARMPPKMSIIPPDVSTIVGPVEGQEPRHDVVAFANYFLIQTPTGDLYLIKRQPGSKPIPQGAVIKFSAHAKRPIRRWQLVPKVAVCAPGVQVPVVPVLSME
jgi:hypothetical protein